MPIIDNGTVWCGGHRRRALNVISDSIGCNHLRSSSSSASKPGSIKLGFGSIERSLFLLSELIVLVNICKREPSVACGRRRCYQSCNCCGRKCASIGTTVPFGCANQSAGFVSSPMSYHLFVACQPNRYDINWLPSVLFFFSEHLCLHLSLLTVAMSV